MDIFKAATTCFDILNALCDRSKRTGVALGISGICNAGCYYCQVGYDNRKRTGGVPRSYVPANEFSGRLQYLIDHGFVKRNSVVSLYFEDEPFLNPEFCQVIEVCNQKRVLISTFY
jgi:wyosine [tRNA(Phe)-imidazoG37] synthetase (radical SAM superfamily)